MSEIRFIKFKEKIENREDLNHYKSLLQSINLEILAVHMSKNIEGATEKFPYGVEYFNKLSKAIDGENIEEIFKITLPNLIGIKESSPLPPEIAKTLLIKFLATFCEFSNFDEGNETYIEDILE